MSTRRPWKFRTASMTAILAQPDAMRQNLGTPLPFRLESRLSPSSSVQNIIGSSMGPSGEGLAIGGALRLAASARPTNNCAAGCAPPVQSDLPSVPCSTTKLHT
jgi:hypothetical protein